MSNFNLGRINRSKFKDRVFILHAIVIFGLIAAVNSNYSEESESEEKDQNCMIVEPSSGNKRASNFTDVLSLIKEGNEHMKIDGHNSRAILIVGNSGVGKTTLSLTINGNLSKLHLARTPGNTDVVVDEDHLIGGPSVTSKTFYPNYIVNPTNNVSFYDCPGFDDNRGAEKDIAAMYFIKAVTEHLTEAKVLLVAKYGDVINGDRNQFLSMTKHAARLLKNTEKFNHSMGFVVTKVDTTKSDSRVIDGVIEHLTSALQSLNGHLRHGRISETQRHEIRRQIIIVETIITRSTNSKGRSYYPKISILRSPTECGPYDKKPEIVDARDKIIRMYSSKLQYAPVTPADFGFTLKDSTSEKVRAEMIPQMKNQIKKHAKEISKSLEQQYLSIIPINLNSTESAAPFFSTLETTTKNLSACEKPSDYLRKIATGLSLSSEENEASNLQAEENLLSFYVNISHHTENVLNNITTELVEKFQLQNKLKEKVRLDFIPRTGEKIISASENICKKMLDQFMLTSHDNFPKIEDIGSLSEKIHSVGETLKDLKTSSSTPSDLIESMTSIFEVTQNAENWGNLQDLEKLQQTYLDFLNETQTFFTDMAIELKKTVSNDFSDFIAWYTNLKTLIYALRSQDAIVKIQQLSLYNLHSQPVNDALKTLANKGIFHEDVNKMKELLRGKKLGKKDVQRLKDILKYFTSIRTSVECHPEHGLVVKGRFVRFGDFIKNNKLSLECTNGKRKKVVVLSSDTVVFDKDFQNDNVESFVILAPKWDMTAERVLNISGKNGEDLPVKIRGPDDSDGRPGRPGGPGGRFYGAKKFGLNIGTLLVVSFGGNGGSGERGLDGANGKNGVNIGGDEFPAPYALDKSELRLDGGKVTAILYNKASYIMDGGIANGKKGKDGGNGGKGGFGGFPGNIDVSCVGHSCGGVSTTTKAGNEGVDGDGGKGGLGGINGHGRRCIF